MRSLLPLLLILGLSACAYDDNSRYRFGVSADRPAGQAMDAETQAALDAKANQICTHGYETVKTDMLKAEGGRQIADLHLHCADYSPDFLPSVISLPSIF